MRETRANQTTKVHVSNMVHSTNLENEVDCEHGGENLDRECHVQSTGLPLASECKPNRVAMYMNMAG